MSKVAKSSDRNKAKPVRRRRPNKKLVTTLDSLADALPETYDDSRQTAAGSKPSDQVNVISRKSIKSRPGALKRRERIDKNERDRFNKNMAQLATSVVKSDTQDKTNDGTASTPSSNRWAALRGFINQTLEKKPELVHDKT